MTNSKKSTTIDFVEAVLKGNEKTLDSLIEKLEGALKNFSQNLENTRNVIVIKNSVIFLCEEWNEFKKACIGAESLSYRCNDQLRVKALQGNVIYEYKEPISNCTEILGCETWDPNKVKKVLSKELNVPENRIILGEMQFPH
jgi:hypothetical protein